MIRVTHEFTCDVCKSPTAKPYVYEASDAAGLPRPESPPYRFAIYDHVHTLCATCTLPLIKLLNEMYRGEKPEAILARNGYRLDETHGEWRKA